MEVTRRNFIKNVGLGLTGLGLGTGHVACSSPKVSSHSEKLLSKGSAHPKPAAYDRLPLSWYKKTVKLLKDRIAEKGVEAILIQGRWNLVYFTGLFHITTERPFYALFPVEEDAIYWYHPGLS